MSCRILVAGGTGVIGRRLMPLLVAAGYSVVGAARRPPEHGVAGAEFVAVNVFDVESLGRAITGFRPEVIIHQLTDLAGFEDPAVYGAAIKRNARIRAEGTRNLMRAAQAAGVSRVIAQSIAWAYAPGPTPHVEEDPLDVAAGEPRATTIHGVVALEEVVLRSPGVAGAVLRYGQLYGPGTGKGAPAGSAPVHVDAAAFAAVLAVQRGASGVFNIAEPGGEVATQRAELVLGWRADFRVSG